VQRYAQKLEYANVMADYLQSLQWTRFCTFTTSYQLTLNSARRLMIRFFDRITTEVFPGEDIKFFYVAEKFECLDSYHTHGLLYYPKVDRGWNEAKIMTESYQIVSGAKKGLVFYPEKYAEGVKIVSAAESHQIDSNEAKMKKWNRVALTKYNKSRAAGKYCAKYLLKSCADYDMLTPGSVDLVSTNPYLNF